MRNYGRSKGDPYEVLGVSKKTTQAQVRRAYRRLAMKWHPDRNPDDPQAAERFKELQWAYESIMGKAGERPKPEQEAQTRYADRRGAADQDHPFWSFFKLLTRIIHQG